MLYKLGLATIYCSTIWLLLLVYSIMPLWFFACLLAAVVIVQSIIFKKFMSNEEKYNEKNPYIVSILLIFVCFFSFIVLPYLQTNYILSSFKESFSIIMNKSAVTPPGKNNVLLTDYFNQYLEWEKISSNKIVTPHKMFALTFEGNGESSCFVEKSDKYCKMILEYNRSNKFEYAIEPHRMVSNYKNKDVLKVSLPFTIKLIKTRLQSDFQSFRHFFKFF